MSKSLLNLLVQISKAMVYSKIKFYSQKNFSSLSAQSAQRPAGPVVAHLFFLTGRSPSPHWASAPQPAHASVASYPVAAFLTGKRLQPRCLRPLLTPGGQLDRTCHPSPPTRSSSAAPPPPPAAPRATQLHLGCRPSLYHTTITPPLLNPPLNLAPTFNCFNAINAAVTPPATPLRSSPGPYKRAMRPLALTTPHPLSPELFRALHRPPNELRPPPFVASRAPPLRHPSVAGEHLPSTASTGSSSPSIAGEHR
jgi:hypothetical protein